MVRHTWFCIERGWTMKKGFCPDGTRSRVVKMKMLSRYQSASIFQPGGAYIAKERWAHSGRLTGVAVPATSGSFLSSRYPTQLLPFHRSMEPPQMRTNFSPTFLFSLSLLLWRGEGKKKCQACNDRESWTRLESVSPPNGRQPMSNSSLRNRLSRFLRPPLTLPLFLSLSLSPPPPLSNEQLRRNWINLDGEKFREAEQPAKTLFRVALQWGHGFVLKGWIFVFPIPNGYRSFREIGHSYPDLVRRRRGKERPGAGLLKFFIVALFPFGQEARLRKTPKASISRKLGRARLEKVARSETAVGENESREKGREKAREEGRTVEKMARDDAFQPSSNRGRNHSKSGRFQRQVSAMGQSSWSLSRRRRKLCE